MKDKDKKVKQSDTPITDGDTRPDQQPHVSQKRDRKGNKPSEDFTSNRASDVNSLEDYKDKKVD
jgi:hypothetical protein